MPKLDLQKNRGREEAGWPGLNIYEKAKEMLSSSEYPPDFIEFLASRAQERADEIYRELEEEQRKQEKSEQRRKEKKRKRTEKQRTAGLLAMFSRFFALREKSRKILLKMYEKDEADYEVHRQEEDFSQFQELAFMSPEASEAAKKIFLVLKYHPDAHRVLEKPWKAAEPNFARLSQCDDFSDFVDHLSWWNSEFLPDAEVSYLLHAIVADGQLPADKAGRYALRETEDEHEYFQWKDFLRVDGIDGSKAVAKELASIYGTPISILQFANLGTFAEEYLFPALMQCKLDPAEIMSCRLGTKVFCGLCAKGFETFHILTDEDDFFSYLVSSSEEFDFDVDRRMIGYIGLMSVIVSLGKCLREAWDENLRLEQETQKLTAYLEKIKAERAARKPDEVPASYRENLRQLQTDNDKLRIANRDLESELASMKEYVAMLEQAEVALPETEEESADFFSMRDEYPDGTILIGGHPRWRKFTARRYRNLRLLDGTDKNINVDGINQTTPLVLINPMHINHPCYWRVMSKSKRAGVPVEFVYPRIAARR